MNIITYVVTLTLIAVPAYAYFDPGAGSMLIQILLAALAAASLFLYRIRGYLSDVFKKKKRGSNSRH